MKSHFLWSFLPSRRVFLFHPQEGNKSIFQNKIFELLKTVDTIIINFFASYINSHIHNIVTHLGRALF